MTTQPIGEVMALIRARIANKRHAPPTPYEPSSPSQPDASTVEAIADAIMARASEDGALHRGSLIDVLRKHGVGP